MRGLRPEFAYGDGAFEVGRGYPGSELIEI
jgi:hypothetical protein